MREKEEVEGEVGRLTDLLVQMAGEVENGKRMNRSATSLKLSECRQKL